MKESTRIFIAFYLFGSIVAPNVDRLFGQYAGDDKLMDSMESDNFWMHFDSNADGNVTKMEFDTVWKKEGLGHENNAPFYFTILDRVVDNVIDDQDLPYIFGLFDEDGNGLIEKDEFKYNWNGLFLH